MEKGTVYNFYLTNRFVVYARLQSSGPTLDRLIDTITLTDLRNLPNLINIIQHAIDATLLELNNSAEILKKANEKNKLN